jgi:D-alanyl-D-alanine-carboxypeptidase/D-alanyl-D-alanine-endopeptidase
MDVPGKADALGLGWVYMKPKMASRGLFRKPAAAAVLSPIWR